MDVDKSIDKLLKTIMMKGKPEEILKKLGIEGEGIKELKELLINLEALGVKEKIILDLSLARGLDYYTNCVFETFVEGGKWSVVGGGRYDKMVEDFGGKPTPATGWSIGVERIITLMDEKGMFKEKIDESSAKVYVAPAKDEVRLKAVELAQNLRRTGIPTDVDLMNRNLKKQLDYVNTKNIPYCVIVGPKDLEKNEVTVRDMKTGKEKKVKIDKLSSEIC